MDPKRTALYLIIYTDVGRHCYLPRPSSHPWFLSMYCFTCADITSPATVCRVTAAGPSTRVYPSRRYRWRGHNLNRYHTPEYIDTSNRHAATLPGLWNSDTHSFSLLDPDPGEKKIEI